MAVYSTKLNRQSAGSTVIQYDEDILYGGVRVGGVSVAITVRSPDAKRLWGVNVISQTKTAALLDQQIDLLYDGAVVGRLSIQAVPDATLPSGHGVTIDTSWSAPVPAEVSTSIVP